MLKAVREENQIYNDKLIKITADFPTKGLGMQ
jgi:hypothetical protein